MTPNKPQSDGNDRNIPLVSDSKDYRDGVLATLLSELTDQMTAGETSDLDAVCEKHPDFADELRDLWGTLVVTQAAGAEKIRDPDATIDRNPVRFELPFTMSGIRLEKEIGRGGMGIVYRGSRLGETTPIAVKIMLKGEFASNIDRMRFEAEAEAASGLDHPHIIPIYEIGEYQGHPFFCMRFIEGETLSQKLADGPMSSDKAARMLLKMTEAIEHAHQRGVLHRDLKPSNVMLDVHEEPFICDFGLAKQLRSDMSLTNTGAIIGTPSYMAPEQAAGARGQISEATEVYGLGAILYHMLTGRPPFMADTPVDTVLLVLEQDPIAPRALNPRADRRLEMIAMRCLQKPQDLRYPKAADLARDLRAYLNNELVSAQEGRFGQVIAGLFRETHNASILENWGALWMWHSLVVFVACLLTNVMFWTGVTSRLNFELMWGIGFVAWAFVFWNLRRRQGPVTFLERQIAHVWAASVIGVVMLFPFEGYLGLPLLSLAPILSVIASMTFVVKAGMLSGTFYIQATALLCTAVVMAMVPNYALLIFGFVCSACFFLPGLKYRRQKMRNRRVAKG